MMILVIRCRMQELLYNVIECTALKQLNLPDYPREAYHSPTRLE